MTASVSLMRARRASVVHASALPRVPGEDIRLPKHRNGSRKRTLSAKTKEIYRRDWAHFVGWCQAHRLQPLPCRPDTLVRYLDEQAPHVPRSVIYRELIVICRTHRAEGKPSPRSHPPVRAWLKAYRDDPSLPRNLAKPITTEMLKQTAKHLYALGQDQKALPRYRVTAIRDRALLLIGRGARLRPLDIKELKVGDIEITKRGLAVSLRRSAILGGDIVIDLPRSKTLAHCPVDAWQSWLKLAPAEPDTIAFRLITHGEVRDKLLAPIDQCILIKRAVHAAGIDASQLSEHSLSAGADD